MNTWKIKGFKNEYQSLARALNITETFAKVLNDFGIFTVEQYETFINCGLANIGNFVKSKDLDKACEVIKQYVDEGKHITLFSDYDCDGVTSTTIMYKALNEIFPNINLKYYVPHRVYDGYGLNMVSIKNMADDGTNLIITLDNGIASIDEVAYANELGVDVIIIDHHEVQKDLDSNEEVLPNALAVIDSKQEQCGYSFKHLCTAGLSFLFGNYLASKNGVKLKCKNELLQFATIGTIVDIVELVGDNRILVKKGLESLNTNIENLGLKSLLNEVGYTKTINVFSLGFIIGPCINSIGRLDHAKKAVELFTTNNEEDAIQLAKEIFEANKKRKAMTNDSLTSVEKIIEDNQFFKDDIIVVYDENIHESLAGNIASKIKEKYYKPTFVITKGEHSAKGSARGIDSYDLVTGMTECKDLLIKFGGHKLAGGFSIEEDKIFDFRKALNENSKMLEEDFYKTILVNKIIPLKDATFELYEELQKIEPCGKGNEMPIFASLNAKIVSIKLDDSKNYFKLELKDDSIKYSITTISFGENEKFKNMILGKYTEYEAKKIFGGILRNVEIFIDIVYNISVNEFNNNISIQLRPIDFRLSK